MEKIKKGYLGVDCGSVGIKLALIDEESKVVNTKYLRNYGIMSTLKKGLESIANDNYEIGGVGVTGSGRHFASYLVGADVVKTEILAHTLATLNFYPDVKTILDIGGEDCKIMGIREGVLENFIMNSICGAGTGSVIDSIATRMGVKIEDVGDLALESKERLDFPGKCGVFTQSSVVSHLNSGHNKSDILMGVIRALVNNYLMLGRGIELKPPYVYQGATSQNKAIVRALEEQLNSEIIVPKYAPEMGAIGIGLIAKKQNIEKSNFKGYYLSKKDYSIKNLKVKGCDNQCEVSMLYDEKKFIGSIGNRCDKCIPKIK
jgi:predicted CoA-substrate-specific enzyme activase